MKSGNTSAGSIHEHCSVRELTRLKTLAQQVYFLKHEDFVLESLEGDDYPHSGLIKTVSGRVFIKEWIWYGAETEWKRLRSGAEIAGKPASRME